MNKLIITTVSFAALSATASAAVLVSDNFDGLSADTAMDSSSDWQAKWQTGTTQQNLYKADGAGGIVLDMSVAELNYHALHQTGFTIAANSSATISLDFTYTHNGGGNPATGVNKTFFGPMVSNTANWWDGSNTMLPMSQRGGAIGNNLTAAPWVENWASHSSLGVSQNGGVADTSNIINLTWTLTDNGTTIDAAGTFTSGANTYTTTSFDTGIATGTTLYGGFSTGWNNVGGSLENATNISSLSIDNFEISSPDVVPEPSSLLIASLSVFGLLRRRR